MKTANAIVSWPVNGPEGIKLHQQCRGTLTTEHAASSYGLPVFVASERHEIKTQFGALSADVAYGPADLPAGYELVVDVATEEDAELARGAKTAGYSVAAQDFADIG